MFYYRLREVLPLRVAVPRAFCPVREDEEVLMADDERVELPPRVAVVADDWLEPVRDEEVAERLLLELAELVARLFLDEVPLPR